jgi:hypothetical protein
MGKRLLLNRTPHDDTGGTSTAYDKADADRGPFQRRSNGIIERGPMEIAFLERIARGSRRALQ